MCSLEQNSDGVKIIASTRTMSATGLAISQATPLTIATPPTTARPNAEPLIRLTGAAPSKGMNVGLTKPVPVGWKAPMAVGQGKVELKLKLLCMAQLDVLRNAQELSTYGVGGSADAEAAKTVRVRATMLSCMIALYRL